MKRVDLLVRKDTLELRIAMYNGVPNSKFDSVGKEVCCDFARKRMNAQMESHPEERRISSQNQCLTKGAGVFLYEKRMK